MIGGAVDPRAPSRGRAMMGIGYEMRTTPDKGRGVFAKRAFAAGDTVMIGVIEKRLKHNHSHASQVGANRYAVHAGLAKLVNHSCAPNCGIKVNQQGGHNFVAIRDIAEDEEISFDYAMRNFTVEHFDEPCRCGAPTCRGTVTGWRDLPAKTKAAYRDFVPPYILECEARGAELSAAEIA